MMLSKKDQQVRTVTACRVGRWSIEEGARVGILSRVILWSVLIDRDAERERLADLLEGAVGGFSGSLVLRGQPGAGKTALVEDTLAHASDAGMTTIRLSGLESEEQLGYAALHRLVQPFAHRLNVLPATQRRGAALYARPGRRAAG